MRQIFLVLLVITASSFKERSVSDKSEELQQLVKFIESPKVILIEDLGEVPDQVFLEIQKVLDSEYNDEQRSDEVTFEIFDQYEAPSRGYRFDGPNSNYRRFNFALKRNDRWLISYHVTTRRFSYNNVVYVEMGKKDTLVKSFQVSRGSKTADCLKDRLLDPGMVEILYPSSSEAPVIIF
jgi:hypothetical protein